MTVPSTLLSPTSTLSLREMVPGAALGGVVGLLLLFYLAGRLYGAQLSAVLADVGTHR